MSNDSKDRSVFGQKTKMPVVDWDLIKEYTNYTGNQLFSVTNGDPDSVYLFPVKDDPDTIRKINQGLYTPVKREDEPDLILSSSAAKDGQYYRINEHIVCKMPKDVWDNLNAAHEHDCLANERRLRDEYMASVEGIGGGKAEGSFETSEQTRLATSWQ